MPLIICVIGKGRSRGKTSLIEDLTRRFTGQGLRIATVKHIHGTFDTTEKDTWRHLTAGATITVASTSTEVVAIRRITNPSIEDALRAISLEADLVLVEGFKESQYPKIVCAENAVEGESTVVNTSNVIIVSGSIAENGLEREIFYEAFPKIPVFSFDEVVSSLEEMLSKEVLRGLPGLDCGHCGYDTCSSLAKAVSRGEAALEDCEVLSTNISTLTVNGELVSLSRFPQEVLRGVIMGVLDTLKGVDKNPSRVEVVIKTGQG